jgi:Pentapeptide repeats (9 copies)
LEKRGAGDLEGSSVDESERYQGKQREEFRCACSGTADYQYEDEWYCILHLPRDNKNDAFKIAVQGKLERHDYRFSGAYFPRDFARDFAHFFSRATFSEPAYFVGATFGGKANFNEATFSEGVAFVGVTFSELADFSQATLSERAVAFSELRRDILLSLKDISCKSGNIDM